MFACKGNGFRCLSLVLTAAALIIGPKFGQSLNHAFAQEAKAESKPAPDQFQVKLETTQGNVVIEVHRDWSPHGADRFHELASIGFFDDCRFFRVLPKFVVQWGIHGDPKVMDKWRDATIKDDDVPAASRQSNKKGFVVFAKSGAPNSRSTQLFVNYANNERLDELGFTPFGKVIEGLDVLEKLNAEYGEDASQQQGRIQKEGNKFLDKNFPGLDSIKKATIVPNKK